MSIIVSTLYDCYDYIIGLSQTECDCYDPKGVFTLDFNNSYSGLFLDELPHLAKFLGMADDCNGTTWEIADNCRSQAIKTFVADIVRILLKTRKLKQNPFYGVIGRRKHDDDRAIVNTYAGSHWFCKAIKSGTVTIREINTIFSETGTIELNIYNNFNELLGASPYTLNTVADTFKVNELAIPLELPLYDDYVDNLEYFFVYEVGTNQPRNNVIRCEGCPSGRLVFSPNRPYFYKTQSEKNGWANYIMVGGFDTDALEFEEEDHGGTSYMNGLVFEADFRCNVGEVLCLDGFDFEADPLALTSAFAIRYKAAEIFVDKLFANSKSFGFATLTGKENLATDQAEWIKKYTEYTEYIAKKINIKRNDCLVCDDSNILTKSGILL